MPFPPVCWELDTNPHLFHCITFCFPELHFHLLLLLLFLTFSTLQCDAIFAPPTDSCCCRHWQRKPWQLAFQWNHPKPLKPSNLSQGYFRYIRIYALPSPLSTYHLLGHDTKALKTNNTSGFLTSGFYWAGCVYVYEIPLCCLTALETGAFCEFQKQNQAAPIGTVCVQGFLLFTIQMFVHVSFCIISQGHFLSGVTFKLAWRGRKKPCFVLGVFKE